jgi:excisionase family DNA binding protein
MKEIILNSITLDEFEQSISKTIEGILRNHFTSPQDQTPSIKYATREEVANILHISKPTLNNLTKTGVLKAYRVGSRVLYNLAEVEESLTRINTNKYKRHSTV